MLEPLAKSYKLLGEIDMNRENQQEIKVSETDLAWLAGLFNGDGCFTMNVRKKRWKGKESIGVDLCVSLTQTDAALVEEAVHLTEAITGITPYIAERAPSGNGINSKLNMRVGRMKHIAIFIEAILPYLRAEKAARARLMLRYVKSRLAKMGTSTREKNPRLDKKDWALVQEFHETKHKATKMLPEVLEILRG